METVAVLGGASPSFPSSHQRRRTCSSLPSTHHNPNLRAHHHHQLSAFPSSLHLFSYFPARPHARTLAKPRIFLPHLVASLGQVDETYIMVKPDGVQRGLVGEIISRFEKKGFKLTGLKLFQCPQDLAQMQIRIKKKNSVKDSPTTHLTKVEAAQDSQTQLQLEEKNTLSAFLKENNNPTCLARPKLVIKPGTFSSMPSTCRICSEYGHFPGMFPWRKRLPKGVTQVGKGYVV